VTIDLEYPSYEVNSVSLSPDLSTAKLLGFVESTPLSLGQISNCLLQAGGADIRTGSSTFSLSAYHAASRKQNPDLGSDPASYNSVVLLSHNHLRPRADLGGLPPSG